MEYGLGHRVQVTGRSQCTIICQKILCCAKSYDARRQTREMHLKWNWTWTEIDGRHKS